jgi:hypothetical protein
LENNRKFAHQNNSVKQKVIRGLHLFCQRNFKTNYSQTNKKKMKGVPENYRLVAFKDMSNEDVLSLNLLNKRNNYS